MKHPRLQSSNPRHTGSWRPGQHLENSFSLFGIEKVVSSTSLSFLGGAISISAEKLLDNFKETDPIVNFRKQLTSFIQKIPKQKLVIIVDELDRCRPDYAMKTLECIKHFFDIEGLFIIIPTNTNALNDCIKSLYGIDNCERKSKENYFQKFFNDERTIKKPTQEDYLFIVNQYLTKKRLKEAFDKKLLSDGQGRYDSYENLKLFFSQYSHSAGLTIRELKDFSLELARICNNFYEPIRIEYLAYLMAYKNIKSDICPLDKESCYYVERYRSADDTNNGKKKLFTMQVFHNEVRQIIGIDYLRTDNYRYINSQEYNKFIQICNTATNGITNYNELNSHIKSLEDKLESVELYYNECSQVKNNLNIIKNALLHQKEAIEKYNAKYGSDDNDNSRKEKYNQIINNAEFLYTTTVE